MFNIVNHADSIKIVTARCERCRPRVVDRMSLAVVSGIFRIDTANNVNNTYMSDVVFVEKRVVRYFVKFKRGAVH